MSGWLTDLGPAGTALALLILGHVLADFVFQTDGMARDKHRVGPLLSHGAVVVVVHLLAFGPLLTPRTAVVVGGVGVAHVLIDSVSARLRHRASVGEPRRFLGDQLAHLIVIAVAWSLLDGSAPTTATVVAVPEVSAGLPWPAITTGALYLAAFAFAHEGGNAVVRGVLPADGPEPEADDLGVGYLIGTLERWLVLLLGLAGLWGAVAIVVAVKSIARFEELKQRPFAEYFLVGTLTSVLVAIVLVAAVSAMV